MFIWIAHKNKKMKLFLIPIFFSTIVLSNDNVINLDSSEITKGFNLENELTLLRAQYDKPPRLKKNFLFLL